MFTRAEGAILSALFLRQGVGRGEADFYHDGTADTQEEVRRMSEERTGNTDLRSSALIKFPISQEKISENQCS